MSAFHPIATGLWTLPKVRVGPEAEVADFGVGSVFRSGAPWSMKAGNIASRCRYDAAARHALQSPICDGLRFFTTPRLTGSHSRQCRLCSLVRRIGHSGSPAFRRPSTYLARSSFRRNGVRSPRSETRSAGLSWRMRVIALFASSILPVSAWLAATTRNAG